MEAAVVKPSTSCALELAPLMHITLPMPSPRSTTAVPFMSFSISDVALAEMQPPFSKYSLPPNVYEKVNGVFHEVS